jgi:hypothetical protein
VVKVLVTGPESSGTSLVARILRSAGAEVCHRSATYDEDCPDMRRCAMHTCDAVVVIFRDPFATMKSQEWTGRAYAKLQEGYHELFFALMDLPIPIYCITYEGLVLNKWSIANLLDALGLNTNIEYEEITDENGKHS